MIRAKDLTSAIAADCNRLTGRRIAWIRRELYGEGGAACMAIYLGVSLRSWTEYEAGQPMPPQLFADFVELTDASADWLVTGCGPRFGP